MSAKRKSPKNYFFIFHFIALPGIVWALSSNNPTHHLLEYGECNSFASKNYSAKFSAQSQDMALSSRLHVTLEIFFSVQALFYFLHSLMEYDYYNNDQ